MIGALVLLVLLNVAGQTLATLDRLEIVEHERDQWQRAPEIISLLQLHDGSRVVDLGSGAGYFALRMSSAVGMQGRVVAVDILRTPLAFLWVRAKRRGLTNIRVIHGGPEDPVITEPVDSVLVANTWHELTAPRQILDRLCSVLIPGGRLVIADRLPQPGGDDHAIEPSIVASELREDGFEIVDLNSHFLDQPGEGPWWLIVAQTRADKKAS